MEHNGVPSHSDQSRNTRLQDVRLEREWAWKTLVGGVSSAGLLKRSEECKFLGTIGESIAFA
jgi:hypothetical protein